MPLPSYDVLSDLVLLRLYRVVTELGYDGNDIEKIEKLAFKNKVPANYIRKICVQLLKEELISKEIDAEVSSDGYVAEYFSITAEGIRKIEQNLSNEDSEIYQFILRNDDWLLDEVISESESDATGATTNEIVKFKSKLLALLKSEAGRYGADNFNWCFPPAGRGWPWDLPPPAKLWAC